VSPATRKAERRGVRDAIRLLGFALANVESAAGGKLAGDLGRAASFIKDAMQAIEQNPRPRAEWKG
jgi:hypothetical protein